MDLQNQLRLAAALALVSACVCAQTYTVKPFAGGALPENVAGVAASLGNISGIAIDRAGNLYLSLGDYDMVARMDAATGMLTRVAGAGQRGFSGDGGPATSARLSSPTGLAVDASGILYIADSGNFRIRAVSNGVISSIAGDGTEGYGGDGGPPALAQFSGLSGLALDSSNSLYVADFYNHAIRKISSGAITTVAGNGVYGSSGDGGSATLAQLAGPSGVAVDTAGNLYIAEGYNNRVRKVANGIITTLAGNGVAGFAGDAKAATAANLRTPSGVAVDASNNVYIADYGNNRVRVVNAAGVITTFAGNGTLTYSGERLAPTSAGLAAPLRLAVDSSNAVLIVDGVRVRKVAAGVIATFAGGAAPLGEGGPAVSAQLAAPQGVAADSSGAVYITDAGASRVLKVTGGTLTRIAGTGNPGYSGDGGAATSAFLSGPTGVAADLNGTVYVADAQNARVRKIANGTITTAAGGGSALGDNGTAISAQLSDPLAVAADAAGALHIADGNRVRTVNAAGVIATTVGTGSGGYQGDNGPAAAAYLAGPAGLAVDSTGNLLIADTGNNRVRSVAAGAITTVAGNGAYGFSGNNGAPTSAMIGTPAAVAADASGNFYITDAYRVLKVSKGKVTTIAGFNAPQGVAVDPAGNVYVAEPATHRVWALNPAGSSCAVAAAPATVQLGAAGGPVALNLQTAASCPWTIESLPAWLTVNVNPFGSGPASVSLLADANSGPPRSSTIVAGGQNVAVNQAGILTITGVVTQRTGAPMPGVTLALGGARSDSATSDSGGNFSFSGLDSAASYTVTPSLAGYIFVPASATYSQATSNPTATFTAWQPPQVSGVGPGFGSAIQSASQSFAAGEIISIYGANLCGEAASAAPTLPDRIAACFARVDGVNLRLYYGSAAQINAVLPQTLATGAHQLVVQRYTDATYKTLVSQTQAYSFTVDKASMAFVELKEGSTTLLAAQYADGGFAGAARPLHPGDYVVLYLTGLGRKAKAFSEGAAPNATSAAVETFQVQAQGAAAQVTYAGVQPQYPGLDQINVKLPQYALPAGKSTVTIQITAPSTGQVLRYETPSY
jgi:uncharacterized protein (TIGR03437 family)